jgi:hypothetical protein
MTSTLNRDSSGKSGQEVIALLAKPCSNAQACRFIMDRVSCLENIRKCEWFEDECWGLRDDAEYNRQDCFAHFWVQIYTRDSFADVNATVSVFRQSELVDTKALPKSSNANEYYWVGVSLDLATSTVSTFDNTIGDATVAESMLGGQEMMPGRALMSKKSRDIVRTPQWLKAGLKESWLEKGVSE